MRDGCLSTGTLRVYPPARASCGHDSGLRSRTIQPRLKILASALSRKFQAQS